MERDNALSLADIFSVIWDWRKKIILATILITAVTAGVVFLTPKQYLSQATIVAANPILGDRSNIFRNTFEQQFYYFGGEGDNDRIYDMARVDTIKKFLIDSFRLEDHYQINKSNPHRRLAAYNNLKENMDVYTTDLGHIQIKIWDTDKNVAANMVNAVVDKVNRMSIDMTNQAKQTILSKLQSEIEANTAAVKQLSEHADPTIAKEVTEAKRSSLLKQIEEKDNLINQFKTSINDVANIYVLEYAYPALKTDRPKRLVIISMAFLAALFLSTLTALLLNRFQRKTE